MGITRTAAAILFAATVSIASNANAVNGHGTPDEQPPAEEQVCEDAGLVGSAFGLCVAFCEANDCDSRTDDKHACSVLRDNYFRTTGEGLFPCETNNEE